MPSLCMICMGLSLVKMMSKSGLPARYSLMARSMTLVADARQYSASMPVFFLKLGRWLRGVRFQGAVNHGLAFFLAGVDETRSSG